MIKAMMMAAALLLALAAGAAAQSAAKIGQIEIANAWARASAGKTGAGAAYFEIRNHGGKSDRLVSAKTDVSRMAALHAHIIKDNIMRMARIDGLEVPAGGRATLKPGGHHLMLMGLRKPLIQGHSFPLSLTFENAGTVTVTVAILRLGARGPTGASGGHDRTHGSGGHKP